MPPTTNGVCGSFSSRADADPLQARDHRQRRRGLQLLGVSSPPRIVTRGARFFLVAALLYWFGEPIREFIERRLTLLTTVFVVALVGGFVAVKYLF